MTSETTSLVPIQPGESLVVRSSVPVGRPYREYRTYLRNDFFHTCAYCTMSESEAHAIRFTIDHYEPRRARPDLVDQYDNLMYCCDECNLRKGDRTPPVNAREDGYRFFRPDYDDHWNHFRKSGVTLEGLSNTGTYSIEALDLNRRSLQRLRDIRERLTKCDQFVAEGILGLRRFHIDQLPPHIKGRAATCINDAISVEEHLVQEIDSILRRFAHSALLGLDLDKEDEKAAEDRRAKLKGMEAIHPGQWRASRKTTR
jgi:HNH endonuclease